MQSLTFVTGPDGREARAAELRHELAELLARDLYIDVTVTSTRSYGELVERLERGRAQVAWLPPAVLVDAMLRADVAPLLACMRAGATSYRGAIFCRREAPWQDASELSGVRVAWVDRFSAAGYLFPRLEIHERGLDPRRLFSSEAFLGSHQAVVRAVAAGEADVGATWLHPDAPEEVVPSGWEETLGPHIMRPILETKPVPSDRIAVVADLPTAVRKKLSATLLGLHHHKRGRSVLYELFGASRLVTDEEGGFDHVRRALDLAG